MIHGGVREHRSSGNWSQKMMTDNSIPQRNGIELKVAEIEGPNGGFKIAFAGTRPEESFIYFYQDLRARFFFYATMISKPKISWEVTSATLGLGRGVPFMATRENEAIFKQNIEFFFKTRNWIRPKEYGDDSMAAAAIAFSWGIVK